MEDIFDGALIVDPKFPFLEEIRNFYRRHPSRSKTFAMNNADAPLQYPYHENENLKKMSCKLQSNRVWDSRQLYKNHAAKIQAVTNSVRLFAKALDNLLKQSCVGTSFISCKANFQSISKWSITETLQQFYQSNYRFTKDLFQVGKDLKENTFALLNYQKNLKVKLKIVGTWERSWFINTKGIQWQNGSHSIPESSCKMTCPVGYIRVFKSDRKCCWICSPCNYKQIVKDDYTCEDCLRGYWPSTDLKTCEFRLIDVLLKGFFCFVSIVCVFFMSVL